MSGERTWKGVEYVCSVNKAILSVHLGNMEFCKEGMQHPNECVLGVLNDAILDLANRWSGKNICAIGY